MRFPLMGLVFLNLALAALGACTNDWKPFENRRGLVARPSGAFLDSDQDSNDLSCSEKNSERSSEEKLENKIDVHYEIDQTTFLQTSDESYFIRMKSKVIESGENSFSMRNDISEVGGIETDEISTQVSCNRSGGWTCNTSGDEDLPKPNFKLTECKIENGTTEELIGAGSYRFSNGTTVPAVHLVTTTTGSIVCLSNNQSKPMGLGKITVDKYLSPKIFTLPPMKPDCLGGPIFNAKIVELENGERIEYVRNEVLEFKPKN